MQIDEQVKFEVRLSYPFSPFDVGEIIDIPESGLTRGMITYPRGFFDKYPEIFKSLNTTTNGESSTAERQGN